MPTPLAPDAENAADAGTNTTARTSVTVRSTPKRCSSDHCPRRSYQPMRPA
ncbi:Uncharacterised protein [Mycobacteroides abscessus]|nr:Uncharacterised protein [Mycobacteroides abscessus]